MNDNSMHEECPTWTDCIADLSEELQVKEAWNDVEYWSLTQELMKRCRNCPRPKEAITHDVRQRRICVTRKR